MPLSCSGSAGKGIFTARGQLCIADTDSHVKETIPGRSFKIAHACVWCCYSVTFGNKNIWTWIVQIIFCACVRQFQGPLSHVIHCLGTVWTCLRDFKLTSNVQLVWCITLEHVQLLYILTLPHVQANCLQSGDEKTEGRTLWRGRGGSKGQQKERVLTNHSQNWKRQLKSTGQRSNVEGHFSLRRMLGKTREDNAKAIQSVYYYIPCLRVPHPCC